MAALSFPAYGSLYFADAPIDPGLKIFFDEEYCIGPHCGSVFSNCNPGEPDLYGGPSPNRGPCKPINAERHPIYCESVEEHIRLLKASQEVLERLIQEPRIRDAATPALVHADLNKRNIYVSPDDPTKITGLIDWQSASIEPAFIYSNEFPDFAALPPVTQGNGDTEGTLQDPDQARLEKDRRICNQGYETCMKGRAPKLKPAFILDQSLFRPFHYCYTSWREGIPAIRQELMELAACWNEAGLDGSCPYSPTEAELKEHARQWEDFDAVQKLKLWLMNSLGTNSDGWIPIELWDDAQEAHRAAYKTWLEAAHTDETMTEDRAERLRPFDAR
ncbi:MAG: hypothetical protein M1819_004957 [Sarea resinae]|nr:MAG: hypothetical protein M1819_004957 [Sarea resinae]